MRADHCIANDCANFTFEIFSNMVSIMYCPVTWNKHMNGKEALVDTIKPNPICSRGRA